MRQKTMWTAGCVLALILTASHVQAQMVQWQDRGYVAVSLGVQAGSQTFTEVSTPEIYIEPANISVPHDIGGGLLLDFAGGMRVWRNLGVGFGISTFGNSESTTLTALIPHPFAQDSPRSATADIDEMNHRQTGYHVQLLWMVPMSNEFELAFVGGPSFYNIKQDFVSNVTPVESDPTFNTVTLSEVTVEGSSETAVGFTIGADGTYLLTPRYGIGAFVRYSGASADLPAAGGTTVSVDAGGFQLGVGLRVRF